MKTYYYIKYADLGAIQVTFGGTKSSGFLDGKSAGFGSGIHDVTRFPEKKHAESALKLLRFMKSKKESKKFRLIKVTVK